MPDIPHGPPILGAPWTHRPADQSAGKAPPQPTPIYAEFHTGPPMRGAPWLGRVPMRPVAPQIPTTPPAAQPTGRLPFLPRVPDVTSTDGQARLRRLTEQVVNIFNSLIRQGILVQTAPADWNLDLTQASGSSGGGSGLTGTFNSGTF